MASSLHAIKRTAAYSLAVIVLAAGWSPAANAALRKVKCGKDDLQKVINAAANGDTIELTGICAGDYRIDVKDLTLVGAGSAGPHGIQGVSANSTALTISRSNSTVLQDLSFSNGAGVGVRVLYSTLSMTDCEVSNNALSAVTVTNASHFLGLRLRMEGNGGRGLQAFFGSRADCNECDLIDNGSFASVQSAAGSQLTLLDSVVSGTNGLRSSNHSYIDIDCLSFESTHACSLSAAGTAGFAYDDSTVALLGAGDFHGAIVATDGSKARLIGALQQSTGVNADNVPLENRVGTASSLVVDPYSEDGVTILMNSRLMGATRVTGFSHALLNGASTELNGSLNCDTAGDAWVDAGIDLTSYTISGCEHAPMP